MNVSVYSTGGSSLASSATTANNAKERVIKLVERQVDPFQPPKFKHKKATGGEGFAHLVALRVKGMFSLSLYLHFVFLVLRRSLVFKVRALFFSLFVSFRHHSDTIAWYCLLFDPLAVWLDWEIQTRTCAGASRTTFHLFIILLLANSLQRTWSCTCCTHVAPIVIEMCFKCVEWTSPARNRHNREIESQ